MSDILSPCKAFLTHASAILQELFVSSTAGRTQGDDLTILSVQSDALGVKGSALHKSPCRANDMLNALRQLLECARPACMFGLICGDNTMTPRGVQIKIKKKKGAASCRRSLARRKKSSDEASRSCRGLFLKRRLFSPGINYALRCAS